MSELSLKCECGKVRGKTEVTSVKMGTRIVCYCEDCQAFPKALGVAEKTLDNEGGSDIFQIPLAHLKITQGTEHIRCLKLSGRRLHRWYADCCKTPIGNTISSGAPLIGILHTFTDDNGQRDALLGPIYGYIYASTPQAKAASAGKGASKHKMLIRIISKLLIWKFKGLNKPSAFYNTQGLPISEPEIASENV